MPPLPRQERLAPFPVYPDRDFNGKIKALPSNVYDLIPKIRQEWIALCESSGKKPDLSFIREQLGWIYPKLLRERNAPAHIVICDSYNAFTTGNAQLGSQLRSQLSSQLRSQLSSQLRAQLESQLRSRLWSQLRAQLESQLGSQLESQLWSRLRSQLWSQLRSRLRAQLESQLRSRLWSQLEAQGLIGESWLANWQFFIDSKICNSALFDEYATYLKSGVFEAVYFKDYCLITACPKSVHRDEGGRLHSLNGSAIEWLDNSAKNYFIHGAGFLDENVWKSIAKKEISAEDAINLPNTEQRTVACQMIGYDTIIAELNAKKIDSWRKKAFGSEQRRLQYYLYEINLHDDTGAPARFLKEECPSTSKEYFIRVPPQMRTCKAALAWHCRLDESEYSQIAIES